MTDDDLIATIEAELAAGILDPEDLADIADADALHLPADLASLTPDDFTARPHIQPRRYRTGPKVKRLHAKMVRYQHALAMAPQLFPLDVGDCVHAVVPGSFIFGDLIEASAKHGDWLIDELWIATLSINAANIESLSNLYAGDYLRHCHLLLSDYWMSHNRGPDGLLEYLYRELDSYSDQERMVQISGTCSHAKIALVGLATGERYVMHGSANLPSSASIEAFCVEHSPPLYEFHRAWLAALEDQYGTINHGVHHQGSRRAAGKEHQWQAIAAAKFSAASTTSGPGPRSLDNPSRRAQPAPDATKCAADPPPCNEP